MLTIDEIKEFKNLVQKIYGLCLTDDEARDHGERVIRLFELIIRQRKQLAGTLAKDLERFKNV